MKLIIAGSRTITNLSPHWFTEKLIGLGLGNIRSSPDDEIVSGGARGVDSCGENFAFTYRIPVKLFPPNWDEYGKAAGHIRNKQMAEYADALLLVWDGTSKGSANMKQNMQKLNKPIYEVIINNA